MQILDLELWLLSSSQEHLLAEGFECWQAGETFGFHKRENWFQNIQVRLGKVSGEKDCGGKVVEKENERVGCYEEDTDFKGNGLPDNKV